MRSPAYLAASLLGLLLGSACTPGSTSLSEPHAAAIRDSVATTLGRLQQFSSTAQWDSLGALYSDAPGFHFVENGAVQYRSASEVRAALAQLPRGTRIESTYRDTEIDAVTPAVAVVTTRFETSFVDSAGGRFTYDGAVTMLWTHEPAGWRIRVGHSSAPVPRRN